MPIGLSNDTEKSAYQEYYIDLGFDEEKVNKFNLVSGSDIFNALFSGMLLFEKIAKQYKLQEKDYAFCLELENAGEVVPFFYGNKYQEYVKRHGIPYAHRENNKSKIIYLKDNPKVHFDEMSGSLIADVLGAAFGFRSDSVFEILQDSNKRYIE